MTTVEIRKSSVMTTEITSKLEKSPTTASGNSSCPSTETEEEKAKRLLYCSLCKVAVNSASQLEAHIIIVNYSLNVLRFYPIPG